MRRMKIERAVEDAAKPFVKQARTGNYGFTDRTNRLRNSLRTTFQRIGKNKHVYRVFTKVPYAQSVEWALRFRDTRPGPPYWLNRAWNTMQKTVQKRFAKNMKKTLKRSIR